MDLISNECTADVETELNNLFSSITENPSNTDNFKRIYWMCENNIPDEVKINLLSMSSLTTLKYHLKHWNVKKPIKTIISNLKLILFFEKKLPELKYHELSKSKYLTEVLRIYNSCLKYLFERDQTEIEENRMLSVALHYVSKFAIKFSINDKTNTMSSFGRHFFKQALSFLYSLKYTKHQFARNPMNSVLLLILTKAMNKMMSKFSAYRKLFVKLNGIQYCINWLSGSYKSKNPVLQTVVYCDLLMLRILGSFVDDPYFTTNSMAITTRLIKYLEYCGERILNSTLIEESDWAFSFICCIIIKMARAIPGFKQEASELGLKPIFMSFLNKYKNRNFAKIIYSTLLVLEETNEHGVPDIFTAMNACERLTNLLLSSKLFSISNDSSDSRHQED